MIKSHFYPAPPIVYVVREILEPDYIKSIFHDYFWEIGVEKTAQWVIDENIIRETVFDRNTVADGAFHSFYSPLGCKKLIDALKMLSVNKNADFRIFEAKPSGITGCGIFKHPIYILEEPAVFSTKLTLLGELND